ncbi:MAG: diguanylate cyclase [Lachnospiraceae bacterium]|nr:diguanylate cyclase [Lachnospiraceae bacterium]
MKQYQIEIYDFKLLRKKLDEIRQDTNGIEARNILFHLFCGVDDKNYISKILDDVRVRFPGSHLVGSLSNGEIFEGHLTDPEFVLTVYAFESSYAEVDFIECRFGTERKAADRIRQKAEVTDPKGIEILTAKQGFEMWKVEKGLHSISTSVRIFGGVSLGHDHLHENAFVFDENGNYSERSLCVIYYYGDDLHVMTDISLGWTPLGREMTVTRVSNNALEELDGVPATQVYSKYLGMEMNDEFFANTIEFPLMLERGGFPMLREPFNQDGSGALTLAADLFEGEKVRIAYGDPTKIMEDDTAMVRRVREFAPDAILLFSCSARKSYWSYFVNKEMEPFQKLAPTSGFYSGGEIIRNKGYVHEHNVALVAVAFREGRLPDELPEQVYISPTMLHGQLSIVQRLACFIKATATELEEVNEKLRKIAKIDELTQLYNRRELEHQLEEAVNNARKNQTELSFIMLDIDHFKTINDTFGHVVGDKVLQAISLILKTVASVSGTDAGNASAGRFGGEEFIIVLPGKNGEEAVRIAEGIRSEVESHDFKEAGAQTVSIGVTTLRANDIDNDQISIRVDEALYQAKRSGRNRVVFL